MIINLDL